jgi:prepilin-type N-terminal cleavage/methylation domain-containing protein
MKNHRRKVKNRSKQSKVGFTLIELMIATGVLALILSVSFPAFARVRISVNEGAAHGALKAYRNAFISYQLDSGTFGFPTSLDQLNGYVDPNLSSANASKQGYNFSLVNSSRTTYTIVAQPTQFSTTGTKTFLLDQSGTVGNISNITYQEAQSRGLDSVLNLDDNFTEVKILNGFMMPFSKNFMLQQTYLDKSDPSNPVWTTHFVNRLADGLELIIALEPTALVSANPLLTVTTNLVSSVFGTETATNNGTDSTDSSNLENTFNFSGVTPTSQIKTDKKSLEKTSILNLGTMNKYESKNIGSHDLLDGSFKFKAYKYEGISGRDKNKPAEQAVVTGGFGMSAAG